MKQPDRRSSRLGDLSLTVWRQRQTAAAVRNQGWRISRPSASAIAFHDTIL